MFIGNIWLISWSKWFRVVFSFEIVKKLFFTILVQFNNFIALLFIIDYIIFRLRFHRSVF